jgi:hypothetical protein
MPRRKPVTSDELIDSPELLKIPVRESRHGKGWRGTGKIWRRDEVREHLKYLEQQYASGSTYTRICELAYAKFGLKTSRTKTLLVRVRKAWEAADNENRAHEKARQSRRILNYIAHARGTYDDIKKKWIRSPDHKALLGWERLYADIHGTKAPVKIEVDVRMSQAVANVMAALTPAQMQEYVARINERNRLANLYLEEQKAKRLEAANTVTVEATKG